MENNKNSELFQKIIDLLDNGNENEAHDLIMANFKSFPEELQEKLLFISFQAEVNKQSNNMRDEIKKMKDKYSL